MNTVDTKVVEMQFNNKDFEQNVATSLSTLDKLKNALNFGKQSQSLAQLQNTTNAVDFSPFTGALDAVQRKFSLLGTIGDQVLRNLTTSIMTSAKNVLTAIPRQISQGGLNRALNIEQAKFMLEGLKVDWDQIEKDISYGVQDTAYGLDAAAKAASQLVASGVKFGDTYGAVGNSPMAKALRGISGVAAMTNSSYEEISSIFTTVAGQGKLMTMQLRQMEARGLNAAAQMGKVMGKTEEEIREMVTKGQIDFATFSEAMDKAFGDQAKKANETYTGALSNVKAALSRIGAEFKASRIENLRQIFVAAIPVINTIKKSMAGFTAVINGMSSAVKDRLVKALEYFDPDKGGPGVRGIEIFMKALENTATVVSKVGGVFSKAFSDRFLDGTIGRLIEMRTGISDVGSIFEVLVSRITISEKTLDQIYKVTMNVLSALLNIGRLGINLFVNLVRVGKALFETLAPLFGFTGRLGLDILGLVSDLAATLSELSTHIANGLIRVIKKASPIIISFSSLLEKLRNIVQSVTEGFSIFIDNVKDGFSKIKPSVKDVTGSFGVILEVIKKIARAIGTFSAELFDSLSVPFRSNDTNYILGFLNSVRLAISTLLSTRAISAIFEIERFATNFKGIVSAIKAPFWDLSIALKGLQTGIKAGALKKIATALLELAVAMVLIASIDPDSLTRSLGAITVMLYELVAATKAVMAISTEKNFMQLWGFTKVIKSLGTAMLMLAIAAKILSTMSWGELAKGVFGIGALLLEISKFMSISGKLGSSSREIRKIASSLIVFAIALNLLVIPVRALGKMKTKELIKGLGAIGSMLLIFAGFFKLLSSKIINTTAPRIKEIAASLVIFGIALNLLMVPVKVLGTMRFEDLIKGVGAIGAMLLIFAGFFKLLSSKIINTTAPRIKEIAASLIIFGVALNLLMVPVKVLGEMNLKSLAKGLGSIIILLGIFAAFSKIGGGSSIKSAGSIFILASAMVVLAAALKTLGGMDLKQIGKGLLAMGAALGILIAAGFLAGKVAIGLLALGGAVALLGTGVLAAGTGVMLMATGFSILLGMMSVGLPVIITFLTNIITLIPLMFQQLGYGLIALLDVLAGSYDSFVRFGITILNATMDGFIQTLPKFMELIGVLIDTICKVLFEYGPKIIDVGVQFVFMLIDGITDAMPELINKGFNLMIALIDGLANAIYTNGERLKKAILNLILSILDFFGFHFKDFYESGKKLIAKVGQGIKDKKDELVNKVKEVIERAKEKIRGFKDEFAKAGAWIMQGLINGLKKVPVIGTVLSIGSTIKNAFKKDQGIASPSKVWKQYGIYITEGLANGLTKGKKPVVKSLKSLIAAFDINGFLVTFTKTTAAHVSEQVDKMLTNSVKSITWGTTVIKQYLGDFTDAVKDSNGEYSKSSAIYKSVSLAVGNLSKNLYKNSDAYKESIGNVKNYNAAIASEQKTYNTLKTKLADLEKQYKKAGKKRKKEIKKQINSTKASMNESLKNIKDLNNGLKTELKNMANGPKEVYQSYRESLRDAIKDASNLVKVGVNDYVNLFERMDDAEEISVNDLLSNMQSQIKGISKWKEDLDKLGERGIAQGLLDKLEAMGPEGAKYIQAFLKMSEEELAKANLMFQAEGELTSDTLIRNMRTQLNAVNNWSENITKLAKKGIKYDFLKDLVDEGPDNAEYVQALVDMTEAEIAEINALYVKQGKLPSNVADNVLAALAQALEKEDKGQLAKSTETITSAVSQAISMTIGDAEEAGTAVAEALSVGIKSAEPTIIEASKYIGDSALTEFKTYFSTESGNTVAIQMTNGIVSGLETGKLAVAEAARALAESAYTGVTDELEIHSPSKKMEELGKYSNLGFANGLKKYARFVEDSASSVSTSAYDTLRDNLKRIYEGLGSDVTNPVITPTLDLSNVSRQAGKLNDMFNEQKIGVNGSGADGGIQNGKVFNFTQNNYSPKALPRIDIYRNTKNLLSVAKGKVGK